MSTLSSANTIAVGCAFTYVTLCLVPVAIFWNQPVQPKVPVTGHIIRILATPSVGTIGYNRHNFRNELIAATQGGLEGRALVDYTDDRCHLGDLVSGWQQGINIVVDPGTCRPPQPENQAQDEGLD